MFKKNIVGFGMGKKSLYLLKKITMEKWKQIEDFEGFEISTYGNVKSLGLGKSTNPNFCKERIMKLTIKKNGYVQVKFSKEGKYYWRNVHRLVANAFIQTIEDKNEVNHINGIKNDNRVENLEWVNSSENQKHAFKLGLQVSRKGKDNQFSKPIRQMDLCGNTIKIWPGIKEACRELGFNSFGIIKCCKKEKKYNTAYKYKWEYEL